MNQTLPRPEPSRDQAGPVLWLIRSYARGLSFEREMPVGPAGPIFKSILTNQSIGMQTPASCENRRRVQVVAIAIGIGVAIAVGFATLGRTDCESDSDTDSDN